MLPCCHGDENSRSSEHRSERGLFKHSCVSWLQVLMCKHRALLPRNHLWLRWHDVPCTPGLLQGCLIQKRWCYLPSCTEKPRLLDPWNYTSRSGKAHLKCKGLGRTPKAFGVCLSQSQLLPRVMGEQLLSTHCSFQLAAGRSVEGIKMFSGVITLLACSGCFFKSRLPGPRDNILCFTVPTCGI